MGIGRQNTFPFRQLSNYVMLRPNFPPENSELAISENYAPETRAGLMGYGIPYSQGSGYAATLGYLVVSPSGYLPRSPTICPAMQNAECTLVHCVPEIDLAATAYLARMGGVVAW